MQQSAVGGITPQQVVNRLAEKKRREREQEEALEKIQKEMQNPKQKNRRNRCYCKRHR